MGESGNPVTPPLGDVDLIPSRRCTRLIGFNGDGSERLCDAPAVVHVDWGDALGFVCADHTKELQTRWEYEAEHRLGPHCGMPGAQWFNFVDGTSYCVADGDGIPVAEPTRAVAREPVG